jgi:hypothetical protein
VRVVNEAVKQGSGELLAAKDLDPLAESQVGRHDGGFALIAVRPFRTTSYRISKKSQLAL